LDTIKLINAAFGTTRKYLVSVKV